MLMLTAEFQVPFSVIQYTAKFTLVSLIFLKLCIRFSYICACFCNCAMRFLLYELDKITLQEKAKNCVFDYISEDVNEDVT